MASRPKIDVGGEQFQPFPVPCLSPAFAANCGEGRGRRTLSIGAAALAGIDPALRRGVVHHVALGGILAFQLFGIDAGAGMDALGGADARVAVQVIRRLWRVAAKPGLAVLRPLWML